MFLPFSVLETFNVPGAPGFKFFNFAIQRPFFAVVDTFWPANSTVIFSPSSAQPQIGHGRPLLKHHVVGEKIVEPDFGASDEGADCDEQRDKNRSWNHRKVQTIPGRASSEGSGANAIGSGLRKAGRAWCLPSPPLPSTRRDYPEKFRALNTQRSADFQIGAIMPGFSNAPIWKSALQFMERAGARGGNVRSLAIPRSSGLTTLHPQSLSPLRGEGSRTGEGASRTSKRGRPNAK